MGARSIRDVRLMAPMVLYLDKDAADRDLMDIMGAVDGIMHSQQLGRLAQAF